MRLGKVNAGIANELSGGLYTIVRNNLEATWNMMNNESKTMGKLFGYLRNYHPFRVADYKGLVAYLNESNPEIKQLFVDAEQAAGRPLTDEEKVAVLHQATDLFQNKFLTQRILIL